MKHIVKRMFFTLFFLTSCGGNISPLTEYGAVTDKPCYTKPVHYSEGVLHLPEQTVEDSFGVQHSFQYPDQTDYCPVSLFGAEGKVLTKSDFRDGEKVVFGWGGTYGKYDRLVAQEIWKESAVEITPFSIHSGKLLSISDSCHEFQGNDGYQDRFSDDGITCFSPEYKSVALDAAKNYEAVSAPKVNGVIELVFLVEV